MDNIYGIILGLEDNLKRYEEEAKGKSKSPYTVLIETLQEPYNELRNFEEFEKVLRNNISEDAAEAWMAFPDFSYGTDYITVTAAKQSMRPELQGKAGELVNELVAADLLYEDVNEQGQKVYIRNYLFGIAFDAMYFPGTSPFEDVSFEWWFDLLDGDTSKLRAPLPEYRVLAHEGTLTGNEKYGRIPMNMEIPDNRELLPMDSTEKILEGCRTIAVMGCLCRTATETNNTRECDYPIEDTCIIFDQMAEGGIAAGYAREISMEEALEIVEKCRNLGLIQQISDAKHPLSLCNCCSCCCICVASMKRFEDNVSKPSRFAADMAHRELCAGCGACVNACATGAIKLGIGTAQINQSKCIGCGICASRCRKGALKMIKRAGSDDIIERDVLDKFYI